jgi:DNA-binding response OmpR family regulator
LTIGHRRGCAAADGRQLADEARRRWPGLKVLLTTGYTRDAVVRHGRLESGVELIVKPFTGADLARKICEVLDRSRGGKARALPWTHEGALPIGTPPRAPPLLVGVQGAKPDRREDKRACGQEDSPSP